MKIESQKLQWTVIQYAKSHKTLLRMFNTIPYIAFAYLLHDLYSTNICTRCVPRHGTITDLETPFQVPSAAAAALVAMRRLTVEL